MPRKTDGEKVDELLIFVNRLEERIAYLTAEIHRLLDLPVRVAILEQRVQSLEQGWERWLQRLWMLLAPLVGAVAGSLLTYYFGLRK